MQDFKDVRDIGVIGGGTAGYFTALYLKKKFGDKNITVIESSKIPIIGVGEASTPLLLKFIHSILGFSVHEFFNATKPTLKLGVKFNWGRKEDKHYLNPFGRMDTIASLRYKQSLDYTSLTTRMMAADKAPFISRNGEVLPIKVKSGMAYHIDNELLVKYLKEKIQLAKINHIDAKIEKTFLKKNNSDIDYLQTDQQKELKFDMYFDCTGFSSYLLGKALKTNWVDYGDSLMTNSAILGKASHTNGIKPYTTASTLNHGWLWETPTQRENHLGYVYSDKFCSAEEARSELRKYCPEINDEKVIRFKSGRYEKSWSGNTIAIGNAFAFVEPLESTGLHMIILQLEKFEKYLKNEKTLEAAQARYNSKINRSWDYIKWFIALHFKYNEKKDTPFWKMVREHTDLSGIQDYLNYYKKNGPVFFNENNVLNQQLKNTIFGTFSFDLVMLGSGFGWEHIVDNQPQIRAAEKIITFNEKVVANALSHEESLIYLENNLSFCFR